MIELHLANQGTELPTPHPRRWYTLLPFVIVLHVQNIFIYLASFSLDNPLYIGRAVIVKLVLQMKTKW